MIYTCHSFFEALAGIVSNLPKHATEIDIRLRATELPEMTVTEMMLGHDERPLVEDGHLRHRTGRFIIVPLEDGEAELDRWERIEKARIHQRARDALDGLQLRHGGRW